MLDNRPTGFISVIYTEQPGDADHSLGFRLLAFYTGVFFGLPAW